MAFAGEERAFCALLVEASRKQYAQRKLSNKFKKKSPSIPTVKKWHLNFLKSGGSTMLRKAPPLTLLRLTPAAVGTINDYFEANEYY